MVINNKVAFIPIPKNASWSVEDTCIDYGFDLRYPNTLWQNSIKYNTKNTQKHLHSTVDIIVDTFGTNLDYVCIIRDSTDRFISAWKYFINAMVVEVNEELANSIKNIDNKFVMKFIIDNYSDFCNAYNSFETRKNLLGKLVTEIGIAEQYAINEDFKKRYAMHIYTFVSQYQWILDNRVNVKQFKFDNLSEFEHYMSEKLDVDFKLIHKNQNKLDYCAVSKTEELTKFVNEYIDGVIKTTKSIL